MYDKIEKLEQSYNKLEVGTEDRVQGQRREDEKADVRKS